MLPIYLFLCVTHLQRSLSRFTCNTLIVAAILSPGHSYIPSVLGDTIRIQGIVCEPLQAVYV